jgi:Fe-S-cluster containining protein
MKKLPVIQEQTLRVAAVQRDQIAKEWTATTLNDGQGVKRVACHKGCDHCCYHPVFVTLPEALWLYRKLVTRHTWSPALRDKVNKTSELTFGLNPAVWTMAMIPCPFLEDHKCSIYQDRPMACRVTLATQDPYYCHPHRILEGLTSIQDRKWAQQQLRDREAKLADQIGLPYVQLPLSTGLKMADDWHHGDQDLESFGWNLKTLLNR